MTLDRDPKGNELPKSVMNKIILFQKKQKKDTIDVWWLSDDGGTREMLQRILTLLNMINIELQSLLHRFDPIVTGSDQQSIQLVRDEIAHFLYGVWNSRIRKRAQRVRRFNVVHFSK